MKSFVFLICLFCCLSLSAQEKSDSTQDGKYYRYDDNNRLVFSGKYRAGLRHGVFKEYDSQGLLLRKSKYSKGKMRWSQVYENGRIMYVIDSRGRVRKKKNCGC